MNLTELNNTVMGLWPKCDWTPDEWALLAETVKRVDHDQAATMLREVRRTQRSSRNPDMQDITKRVRAMLLTPATSGTFHRRGEGLSKWEAQRTSWKAAGLSDYDTFRRYWQSMRDSHGGTGESFARMWHGYCAIDARELGATWEQAEEEAAELTGGTPRIEPSGDRRELWARVRASIKHTERRGPKSAREDAERSHP